MDKHVRLLGLVYIVFGALGIFSALVMALIVSGTAGIVGLAADNPDAWLAIPILGVVGTALFFFMMALSLPAVLAGWGLLKLYPWARILALVLSVLNLLNLPLGTLLGIYGLWVLLSKETEQLFARSPAPLSAS